eukprot:7494703-Lingulodinium_polyedra.AAC.1
MPKSVSIVKTVCNPTQMPATRESSVRRYSPSPRMSSLARTVSPFPGASFPVFLQFQPCSELLSQVLVRRPRG